VQVPKWIPSSSKTQLFLEFLATIKTGVLHCPGLVSYRSLFSSPPHPDACMILGGLRALRARTLITGPSKGLKISGPW
jgi:hypothetical protein